MAFGNTVKKVAIHKIFPPLCMFCIFILIMHIFFVGKGLHCSSLPNMLSKISKLPVTCKKSKQGMSMDLAKVADSIFEMLRVRKMTSLKIYNLQ